MSEMESSYNDMMAGSIYACIKWIRLTSGSEAMPFVADLIESEINVRNDEIQNLRVTLSRSLDLDMAGMLGLLIEAVTCIRFNVTLGAGKPSDDIRSVIARIDAMIAKEITK